MSIPHSLNAPDRALPILAEFFAPLSALGCAPRRIVGWLRESGLTRRHTLLDLGCGKGAVAIAAARAIGCRAVGVDAFEPFLASARTAAARSRVETLCDFRRGDVHRVGASVKSRFDAVVLLNVLPLEEALPIVRRWAKPGGVYIIDDAVRVAPSDAYADAPTLDEAAAQIERRGDRIERVHVEPRSEILRRERTLYRKLERHARELIRATPRRAGVIRECLAWQREAMGELTGPIRPACWLVRRSR